MILIKNKILICCKCNKIIQGDSKNYVQEFNDSGLIGFTHRACSRLKINPSDSRQSDSRQSDSRQSDSRQSDSRQSDSRQSDSRASVYPHVKREV